MQFLVPALICSVMSGSVLASALPRPSPESRILGGSDLDIRDAPYQVSLQLGGRHFCAGAILSEKFVLTSASCVSDVPRGDEVTIHAGISDLSEDGETVRAVQISTHPDYNPDYYNYDIAVLQVAPTLNVGTTHNTAAVDLPVANSTLSSATVLRVSGWGIKSLGIPSGTLQSVDFNAAPRAECISAYNQEIITLFCADSCLGEPGDPVVLYNGTDPLLLLGVVALGDGKCVSSEYDGIYTYTGYASIRNFITSVTGL